MQCTRKTPLDCAQWDGSNAVEIGNVLGAIVGNPPYADPFVCGGLSFSVGDWAVMENSVGAKYTNEQFEAAFIVLPLGA